MRKLTAILIGLILLAVSACSQNSEFKTYSNGLIYSEGTMIKLSHIVDSLNLKFKTCDFDKVFLSKQQSIGHLVRLESGNIETAIIDMEKNISFDDFCKKYPEAEIEENILIMRDKYQNYNDETIVDISQFDLSSNYGFRIISEDTSLYERNLEGKWLFKKSNESEYSKEGIKSFFFPGNFQTKELPKKYSLMVGYSECLIDTTTTKFKNDLNNGWVDLPKNWNSLSQKKKEKLLDEMRSTRVIGGCSQDSRPREHALNIALLSAETYNWEVFLKAHLDVMNDRFERVSDGSYAWGKRNTYIKELEDLNINVTDLILGITFRIENPASNHYYGSIRRIGRALSETTKREEVENAILSIITDNELDFYNRMIFYFLFDNYNYYIEDETIKDENVAKLEKALATLPSSFTSKLTRN